MSAFPREKKAEAAYPFHTARAWLRRRGTLKSQGLRDKEINISCRQDTHTRKTYTHPTEMNVSLPTNTQTRTHNRNLDKSSVSTRKNYQKKKSTHRRVLSLFTKRHAANSPVLPALQLKNYLGSLHTDRGGAGKCLV